MGGSLVSAAIEVDGAAEDRVRWFEPNTSRRAASWLGMIVISLVFGGVMLAGHLNHRDSWIGDALFSLPILGQLLSVLYVSTVKVRIDKDSFHKASIFGQVTLPIADITRLRQGGDRSGAYLAITAGGRTVRCSASLFTQPRLEDMRATLAARAPPPPAETAPADPRTPSVAAVLWGVAAFHGLLFLLGLNFAALKSRFLPTRLGDEVLYGGPVAIGLLAAVGAVLLAWPRTSSSPAGRRRRTLSGGELLAKFLSTMVAAAYLSMGAVELSACWYTDLTGPMSSRVLTVAGYHGGRGCSSFEVVEADPLNDALCADRAYLHRHPIGSKLIVVGPTSVLGSDVRPVYETNP